MELGLWDLDYFEDNNSSESKAAKAEFEKEFKKSNSKKPKVVSKSQEDGDKTQSQRVIIRQYYEIYRLTSKGNGASQEQIFEHLTTRGIPITNARTFQRRLKALRDEYAIAVKYDPCYKMYVCYDVEDRNVEAFLRLCESNIMAGASLLNLQNSINFIQYGQTISPDALSYIPMIVEAIKKEKCIKFRYKKFEAESSYEIEIAPCFLKEFHHRWYVIGFITSEDSVFRTYALDRILNLGLTSKKNKYAGVTLEVYDKIIGLNYNSVIKGPVVLRFTQGQGDYFKTLPWHKDYKILKEENDELTVKIKADVNYEFIRIIMQNIDKVIVEEPLELVNEIKNQIKGMMKNYNL